MSVAPELAVILTVIAMMSSFAGVLFTVAWLTNHRPQK